MTSPLQCFYAQWRAQPVTANCLHDKQFPAERLLQAIWQYQRLKRGKLKTVDGKIVRVFHPGFASLEGGPDFRDALLQIGDDAPHSGNVEIDLRSNNWHTHGHDKNKNFKDVILRVVWDEVKPTSNENIPAVLCLKNILDAPLAELSLSLENESLRSLPENLRGKCCAPLRELNETKLAELLRHAACARFENKTVQFRSRAKDVGWEQTLWENLFRALGYARVTDLPVNVILPWFWIRAKEGGNEKIRREMEGRFFAWPTAEDNSILKLARQRLLGTSNARVLKTAASQQGLTQIVRDFCGHSNAVCDDCRFPELVRGWKIQL